MKRTTFVIFIIVMGAICFLINAPAVFGEQKIGVIVVDMQGDFTTWKKGSLAVNDTDGAFVAKVEKTTVMLKEKGYPIFATQDWHPAEHVSFFSNNQGTEVMQVIEIDGRPQVMWPPHCVQNTPGAEILITVDDSNKTVRKGMDPPFDSYSGFADDGGHKTDLDNLLQKDGIKKVILYGLATDYCVKATALDAIQAGYKVDLIIDLCRGVSPDTTASALEEMKDRGVTIVRK